jgi:hypothetical protein
MVAGWVVVCAALRRYSDGECEYDCACANVRQQYCARAAFKVLGAAVWQMSTSTMNARNTGRSLVIAGCR